jgi:putative tryptophan/tyrosine transport system substrate-binding protein
VRRREFITLIGGASAAWPLATRAQSSMPVIGFLGLTSPQEFAALIAAFKQGLGETGFVEGRNVAVEYRWAHGQFEQLPALAADLAQKRVSVIAALGTPASAMAAKRATTTIPIVFVSGGDPVAIGLVDSLNRPVGNTTGIYMLTVALEPKRLELMHEVMPNVGVIGVIADPKSPDTVEQLKELTKAATVLGREIQVIDVSSDKEVDAAFAAMAERHIGAAIVTSSPGYLPLRERFIALAARHAIPTAYYVRSFADAGGLLSYGTSFPDAYRQAGVYTGRLLKGDKPADLPIQQSVKVELVINLKTAKTLGLTIPLSLLGRADEVIE